MSQTLFYIVALPLLGCVIIILYAMGRLLCGRKLGPRLMMVTGLAAVPVAAVIALTSRPDPINEKASDLSREDIIGIYIDSENHCSLNLNLNADGTFTSHGLPEPTEGTWLRRTEGFTFTVTLVLTNETTRRREIPFIRRNGTLYLAPEYDEPSMREDIGVLLEKQEP